MLLNSVSASKPWIAFKSCANSNEYSAFNARLSAVTVTFSIEKAICLKAAPAESPNVSATDVGIPIPEVVVFPVGFWKVFKTSEAVVPWKPYGFAAELTPENTVFASLKNASSPD